MSSVGGIGIGSNIFGGFFSGMGAGKQAAAQSQQFKYEASIARLRNQIDIQNAGYALQEGELQASQYGMQAAQRMGQIKAAQGASGLDVNSGSPQQVQQSQKLITGIDLDTIRTNAAKTAYSFDVQGAFDTAQANLYDMASADALKAGMINGFSSAIGTAGSVSSKWLQGQQMGLWSGPSSSGGGLGSSGGATQFLGS